MQVATITMPSKPSTAFQSNWRQDPDAETILRHIVGLPFMEGVISLGDVDWSESANNCARLSNPLNAEKIEDYATCMRAGDAFPMLVVERQKKKNLFVILGGNQRAEALKSIDPNAAFKCYILDPLTTDERELVIRSLNSRHGWGSSKEERIEHAVYLVRKHGMHVGTVARAMVVSDTAIHSRIRAEDERARLAQCGVNPSKLAIGALSALTRIADEKIRTDVAETVVEKNATAAQTSELVSAVAASPSRAKTSALIAEFRKAADIKKQTLDRNPSGKMKKPRREKFLRLIVELSDFLERGNDGHSFSTLDELSCSVESDLQNVRVMAAKINARLQCICEAGK